jgi:hypothetical protein
MAPTKSGSADDIVSSLSSRRSTHLTSASVNKAFHTQLDLGSLQISQHTSSCGSSTPDAAAASATADCPLFTKLPAELLATICDLVAEDESRPVLRVEIKQDATTQQKHPQISAFVIVHDMSVRPWSPLSHEHQDPALQRKSGGRRPKQGIADVCLCCP